MKSAISSRSASASPVRKTSKSATKFSSSFFDIRERLARRLDATLLNEPPAEGDQLQNGQGLLHGLVGVDILDHHLALAVVGDDHRLACFRDGCENVGGVGFHVGDGLDRRFPAHWTSYHIIV